MIIVNIDKAKNIAHDMRRTARAEEFKPYDVLVTVPGKSEEAEAARQEIRDKYAVVQEQIDAAGTPEAIKLALEQGGV